MNDTPTGPSRSEDGTWNEPTHPQDLGLTPSSPTLDTGDAATDIATNADTASGLQPSKQATIADRRPATSATASWHGVPEPVEPPRRGRPRWQRWPLIGAALAVVLSAGTAGYLTGEPGHDTVPASANAPAAGNSTTTTATESTTTAVSETTPSEPKPETEPAPATSSRLPGVLGEPAGLFCRDLDANGYSYAEAVTYWEHHGRPSHMDASGMGIPCRTVYPSDVVEAHWGSDALTSACPDAAVLLSAFVEAHPENAAYTAGLRDIRCTGSWVFAIIEPNVPSDPGAAIFRTDSGAPSLVTYGSGMDPAWCVEEFGMPADVANQFC